MGNKPTTAALALEHAPAAASFSAFVMLSSSMYVESQMGLTMQPKAHRRICRLLACCTLSSCQVNQVPCLLPNRFINVSKLLSWTKTSVDWVKPAATKRWQNPSFQQLQLINLELDGVGGRDGV